MSELKTNLITPYAGTTVTMGESGNTVALAAGATATGFGKVVQVVNVQTGAVVTGSTVIPLDNTVPQITEGNEFMTLAITPTSATNKLLISVNCCMANSHAAGNTSTVALFQDSTANAIAASTFSATGSHQRKTFSFEHYMTSGTASATTFKVRGGSNNAGTATLNGGAGVQDMGGVLSSSITITEISA